ncbi:uncharacterized protein LOC135084935 [Ostrinia nubilalis]|uniref:uncharacterized protein LOC135084935 n=1 Tax=Ostrinia nubilalis TaxID=29057 RepID=UPI0030825945
MDSIARSRRLNKLDVRHNRLDSFEPALVKGIRSQGLTVYYEGNGLKCDCFARPLKHYLNRLSPSVLPTSPYNLTCTEPLVLQNEQLLAVDEERLLCEGSVAVDNKLLEYGNTEGDSVYDFTSEPDLVFRDVQYAQEAIYANWYVPSIEDIADVYLYIRDDKNSLLYSKDMTYNLRSTTIPIDNTMKESLEKGGKFDICIQAKTSSGAPRKWFDSQCQPLPPNFDSWQKKLNIDKRRLTKKKARKGWFQRNSVLGLVSDSILITLCIFLGVCLKLTDLEL